MTRSEAQAAVMIYDIEDVNEMTLIPMDEPTMPAEPTLDSAEGDELYLGVSRYA
jgi:hypothetical protein